MFPQVNNVRNWQAWSPWMELDPAMKLTYTGPAEGTGAAWAWDSKKAGAGQMTVAKSQPNELVDFRLEFLKPFQATDAAEFTFKPDGGQTVVTWTMTGSCNFASKAMNMLVGIDRVIGSDFEKGLAKMKSVVESGKK